MTRRLRSMPGCSAATAAGARILERLGHEANDALDEFLELALNYERKAPASLQGFMAWLRAADTEVKRDMEISRDEVRVMTVHGAKGLEASVVYHRRHHDVARRHAAAAPDPACRAATAGEADGLGRQEGRRSPGGRGRARGHARRDRGRISPPALCGDDARGRPADRRRLQARQSQRCARALLVRSDRKRPGATPALQCRRSKPPPARSNAMRGRGWQTRHRRAARARDRAGRAAAVAAHHRRTEAPAEPSLRPSDASDDARHSVRTGESRIAQRSRALQRGTLVHRLLQSLPDIAATRRRDAALGFLARNASGLERGRARRAGRASAGADR